MSTRVTGIPELVRDGETGLLTEPGDHVALADAIERLLEDELLRTRLAEASRRLIEDEFDIHSNTALAREILSLIPAGVGDSAISLEV